MTITEAHREFKFRYDKNDALNYPNYEPEEIDLILNYAQDRIVKQRYGLNNLKRQSFEETQKRIEDLRELIRHTVATPVSAKIDNLSNSSYNVELSNDHWFTIWEKAIISVPGCNTSIRVPLRSYYANQTLEEAQAASGGGGASDEINAYYTVTGKEVEVIPVTHVELEKIKDDAFKGPDKRKILRLMYRNRVELIPNDAHTVVKYIYRYIKKPTPVDINTDVTFELSDHLHSEIIDEAVTIALEGTEAKRLGTFKQFIDNLKE